MVTENTPTVPGSTEEHYTQQHWRHQHLHAKAGGHSAGRPPFKHPLFQSYPPSQFSSNTGWLSQNNETWKYKQCRHEIGSDRRRMKATHFAKSVGPTAHAKPYTTRTTRTLLPPRGNTSIYIKPHNRSRLRKKTAYHSRARSPTKSAHISRMLRSLNAVGFPSSDIQHTIKTMQ